MKDLLARYYHFFLFCINYQLNNKLLFFFCDSNDNEKHCYIKVKWHEIFNVVQSTLTLWCHIQRIKRVRSVQKVQTSIDLYKEKLFTIAAIVFVVMLLNILWALLVLLEFSLLNFLQSLSQPSLKETYFQCPILPPEKCIVMQSPSLEEHREYFQETSLNKYNLSTEAT